MSTTDKIAVSLMLLCIGFISGFLCGYYCHKKPPISPLEPKVDTLYYHDTITSYEPIYITRKVVDSIRIPVVDTMRFTDTLYIQLAKEQIVWEDSLARVYASGVYPHVDSVLHFTERMVIEKEIPVVQIRSTRWGIGVQAGYGIGKGGLSPYVGVGVSYNLLSW